MPVKDAGWKEKWMRRAWTLARKGEGRTAPNPPVGAVIVRGGRMVAEGYHKRAGALHAEAEALRKAGGLARGATLFVTLEPCCHQGKTPPCTGEILNSGIRRVILGVRDPNPRVRGRGIRRLRQGGVDVETGVLPGECEGLIEPFAKFIRTGRPFVILKSAISLDGKIATRCGESQWITSPEARARVHDLRSRVDALLVGARTVIQDDPRLTARPKNRRERYPVRVILDPRGQVPIRARVFNQAETQRVIYAAPTAGRTRRTAALEKKGVEVVRITCKKGKPDMPGLMDMLGERGIMALMIEGGGGANALALEAGVVDKMMWFIAPLVLGGSAAPTAVEGAGAARLKDAWKVKSLRVEWVGRDLLAEGYF